MRRWAKLTRSEHGEAETSDPKIGKIIYIVEPVKIDGKTIGVFAAAHTTANVVKE